MKPNSLIRKMAVDGAQIDTDVLGLYLDKMEDYQIDKDLFILALLGKYKPHDIDIHTFPSGATELNLHEDLFAYISKKLINEGSISKEELNINNMKLLEFNFLNQEVYVAYTLPDTTIKNFYINLFQLNYVAI